MALSLGLPQFHRSGALVPHSSPTWGLAHRPTQPLHDQRSSCEVCGQLNQYLAPHVRCQTTQEPIQHLRWRCVGDTQQTAAEAVYIVTHCVTALHASCPAVMCTTCHINRAELLLEQSLKLAPCE